MSTAIRSVIDDFLAQKRIAFVGLSRDPKSFSRTLFREFVRRGYDAVPVNSGAAELEGVACHARIQDVQPPVDGALILTSRDAVYRAIADCQEAGVRRVWIYGVSGPRGTSAGAVEFCAAHGMELVPGYCPFMFLPESGLIHRFHGRVMKLMGTYPG
jgi:predicted CoA-binding protein